MVLDRDRTSVKHTAPPLFRQRSEHAVDSMQLTIHFGGSDDSSLGANRVSGNRQRHAT